MKLAWNNTECYSYTYITSVFFYVSFRAITISEMKPTCVSQSYKLLSFLSKLDKNNLLAYDWESSHLVELNLW